MLGKRNGNRQWVLELTLAGRTASQIAAHLKIAVGTVYSHRHQLRKQGRLAYETITPSDRLRTADPEPGVLDRCPQSIGGEEK